MKMRWTIKLKLVGLSILGALFVAGAGGSGFRGLTQVDRNMDEIVVTSQMMRSHLEADMMHDAIRGDVLAAFLAAENEAAGSRSTVLSYYREHTEMFKDRVETVRTLAAQSSIGKNVMEVYPALKEKMDIYIQDAENIISLAFSDRQTAFGQLEHFNLKFDHLALEMEKMSGLLEAGAIASQSMGDAAVTSSKRTLLLIIAMSLLVLSMFSYYIVKSIVVGMADLTRAVEAVTAGDLSLSRETHRSDEIGYLSNQFREMTRTLSRLVSNIKDNAANISSASEQLSASSTQMSANTDQVVEQVRSASESGGVASRSLETVSTSSEEMSATIKEISTNVQEATRITTNAVEMASVTNETVNKLGNASQEIGDVVKVIKSIAQQTNLLALNATIEAARAGEAGKGFAVVANEVKDLAKATAKATEEINQKITAIQANTTGAVTAIGEIEQVINQINDISTNIAGAIEEQSVTTNEISRSVAEAAKETADASESISHVEASSQGTAEGAANVLSASQDLAKLGAQAMAMVNKFHIAQTDENEGEVYEIRQEE